MIKISITGPESSGKTALSEWLTLRLQDSLLLPEYARDDLESKPAGYRYTENDVLICAEQTHSQLTEIDKSSNAKVLICDTDFYVLDIWHRVVFGKEDKRILELKSKHSFDVYILCKPDLPWYFDPLRENEHDRDMLFELYENELKKDGALYITARGEGEERYRNVLKDLLRLFPSLQVKE